MHPIDIKSQSQKEGHPLLKNMRPVREPAGCQEEGRWAYNGI